MSAAVLLANVVFTNVTLSALEALSAKLRPVTQSANSVLYISTEPLLPVMSTPVSLILNALLARVNLLPTEFVLASIPLPLSLIKVKPSIRTYLSELARTDSSWPVVVPS